MGQRRLLHKFLMRLRVKQSISLAQVSSTPTVMARNRAAPKPAPIVVQHENVEGGATYGINRWNRYKLVSDHKIYEDEQKEFKISRCPNFWVDDANVPKDVYGRSTKLRWGECLLTRSRQHREESRGLLGQGLSL